MYCSECGERLDEGAAFCPMCGTPVSHVAPVAPAAVEANEVRVSSPRVPAEVGGGRRRSGRKTLALCLVLFALVFVGEVLGFLVGELLNLDVEIASTVGGALCAVASVALMGGASLLVPSRRRLAQAFELGWWVILVSLVLFAFDLVGSIVEGEFVLADNVALSVASVAVLCLAVGVVEECLFRGLLLEGLLAAFGSTRRGVVVSVVLSSVLFGAAHIDWTSLDMADVLSVGQAVLKVAQTGIFGLFLAALTLQSESLVGPITLHALSDFLLLVSYMGIQGQSSELNYVALGEEEALATMALYAVVIALYVPILVRGVRMVRTVDAPEHGAFTQQ